jgi:hypothetical protein
MVHVVGDKEKTSATQEFQRIVDQTNKNIFGDSAEGQISTLYNNFVDDVYGA